MTDHDLDQQRTVLAVFGPKGVILSTGLRHVLSSLGTFRYSFMPQEEFDSLVHRAAAPASQVYWSEVLYRAHFSSLVALLRCQRWLAAIHDAVTAANLLSFAAAYRGLLESAADTQDTFLLAEASIAEYYRPIAEALAGNSKAFFIVDQLEDTLIHFMYARRLRQNEKAPPSHRAKNNAEYLDTLRRMSGPKVLELYGELCSLAHPAGPGVMAYALPHGDGSLIEYWPRADETRISELSSRYSVVAPEVLMAAVNPPLVMLKLLNCFAHPALATPVIDQIDLSEVPAWRKTEERVSKSRPVG